MDSAHDPPPHPPSDADDHDLGLTHDLGTLMARRRALRVLGGAGLGLALAACGASGSTTSSAATSTSTSSTTTAASAGPPGGGGPPGGAAPSSSSSSSDSGAIPEETAGPYPGDGSNGPDVLLESGIVRRDITSSLAGSGTADGVPFTLTLAVTDAATGDPLPGTAVYVWHCTREGGYSMYSAGLEDETFLRGVQEADADGAVTFTTIVPGAYDGRWPHIHLEVYETLAEATSSGAITATSQVALPEAMCDAVYATEGYEDSVANLARTSLESDMVFADDGGARQTPEVTGSVADGYVATLTLPVSAS